MWILETLLAGSGTNRQAKGGPTKLDFLQDSKKALGSLSRAPLKGIYRHIRVIDIMGGCFLAVFWALACGL